MIRVLMILLIGGSPPIIGMNARDKFDTVQACEEALPRLDKEAEEHFKGDGKTRGEDYQFTLKCVGPREEKV